MASPKCLHCGSTKIELSGDPLHEVDDVEERDIFMVGALCKDCGEISYVEKDKGITKYRVQLKIPFDPEVIMAKSADEAFEKAKEKLLKLLQMFAEDDFLHSLMFEKKIEVIDDGIEDIPEDAKRLKISWEAL
ncbi:MAG: hypothetical protein ACTSSI_16965 [Candidatus Helarchaeota archaeon]